MTPVITTERGVKTKSPYTGKPSARPRPVSPGGFSHRQGEFATIPSPPLPVPIDTIPRRLGMRFLRQGGIYRSDVVQTQNKVNTKVQTNPRARPTASRWSAPSPGKRTRREEHALLIVRGEFRTGYSLIGLLASRARLRFTGIARIHAGRFGANRISSNGNSVFSLVSHLRGAPQHRR